MLFGICCSQYDADVRHREERIARKRDTRAIKLLCQQNNIPRSPIEPEEEPEMETFEERMTRYEEQNPYQEWYRDSSFL